MNEEKHIPCSFAPRSEGM